MVPAQSQGPLGAGPVADRSINIRAVVRADGSPETPVGLNGVNYSKSVRPYLHLSDESRRNEHRLKTSELTGTR